MFQSTLTQLGESVNATGPVCRYTYYNLDGEGNQGNIYIWLMFNLLDSEKKMNESKIIFSEELFNPKHLSLSSALQF